MRLRRLKAVERDAVRLADALNQLCMTLEDVAMREMQGARARIEPKREERMRSLYQAARETREHVAPIIDRLDP